MEEEHIEARPRSFVRSVWSTIKEVVRFALIALIIVVPIRIYIAQPYIVSGASMDPTFANGDYLIVDQLSYRLAEPERGEVVIFRFPQDPSKFFIKRIIGVPGDSLSVNQGTLFVTEENGRFTLDEPYLVDKYYNDNIAVELEEGEYFVMGDNRSASLDSRTWGTLPRTFITGKVLLRLFPVAHAEILPGDAPGQLLLEN
jgi:signal peptidase I